MPMFKVKMSEPGRRFPHFGDLKDGDVITAETQPSDGVTWSWSETVAKSAEPVAAEPVVPESALPPVTPESPAS